MKNRGWALKLRKMARYIAMVWPLGYFPASGTVASLAAYSVFYIVSYDSWLLSYKIIFLLLFCVCALGIIHLSLPLFPLHSDPREIVLDELVGVACALFISSSAWYVYCINAIFFRFFDITKWGGIKRIEKMPGALGIVFDDFIAGLYAMIATLLILQFI